MKLALFVFVFFACVYAHSLIFTQCQNCTLRNFQFLKVRYPFTKEETFICNDQRDVIRGPMFVTDVVYNLEMCKTINKSLDLSEAMKHFQSLQVKVDSEGKAIASASLVVVLLSLLLIIGLYLITNPKRWSFLAKKNNRMQVETNI